MFTALGSAGSVLGFLLGPFGVGLFLALGWLAALGPAEFLRFPTLRKGPFATRATTSLRRKVVSRVHVPAQKTPPDRAP